MMSIALLARCLYKRGQLRGTKYVLPDTTQASHIEKSASTVKTGEAASSKFIINRDFVDSDSNCEFCTAMLYTPGIKHEAGVAYKDDKISIGDSKRLVFFVKGQPGQEVKLASCRERHQNFVTKRH